MDREAVHSRLRVMDELLDHLDGLRADGIDVSELAIRLQIERILSALVDLAVAINAHVVVQAGLAAPPDMTASFDAAATVGLIEAALARELRPSVGLRNIVIHAYADLDLTVLAEAVPLAAAGYRTYVRSAARWLADRPADTPSEAP